MPFDVRLQGIASGLGDEYSGLILPIWPRDAKIDPVPNANRKGKPSLMTYADYWKSPGINVSTMKSVVLDMREAPGDIADTLAILKAPPVANAKPVTGSPGMTRAMKR